MSAGNQQETYSFYKFLWSCRTCYTYCYKNILIWYSSAFLKKSVLGNKQLLQGQGKQQPHRPETLNLLSHISAGQATIFSKILEQKWSEKELRKTGKNPSGASTQQDAVGKQGKTLFRKSSELEVDNPCGSHPHLTPTKTFMLFVFRAAGAKRWAKHIRQP